ncbi:MAG TPA: hypothetical protein VK845_06205 [Gemmatimonadales bacterium]|nr:hypothetical protein [Gemmatimonadales bacterium]
MNTATFLVLGIVLAMVALVLSAVVSLPHRRRRARERGAPAGATAKVLCPERGNVARVRIGVDPARMSLGVLACEHFSSGVIACDQACFQGFDQVLAPAH